MTHSRAILTALAFGLVALPTLAGSIYFDLPRLDFPAPGTETSRDCASVAVQGGAPSCAPSDK